MASRSLMSPTRPMPDCDRSGRVYVWSETIAVEPLAVDVDADLGPPVESSGCEVLMAPVAQ